MPEGKNIEKGSSPAASPSQEKLCRLTDRKDYHDTEIRKLKLKREAEATEKQRTDAMKDDDCMAAWRFEWECSDPNSLYDRPNTIQATAKEKETGWPAGHWQRMWDKEFWDNGGTWEEWHKRRDREDAEYREYWESERKTSCTTAGEGSNKKI